MSLFKPVIKHEKVGDRQDRESMAPYVPRDQRQQPTFIPNMYPSKRWFSEDKLKGVSK